MAKGDAGRDKAMVRDINLGLLLEELRRSGPLTPAQIASSLHLGRGELSWVLDLLCKGGMIREVTHERKRTLEINPAAGAIIGVDFQDDAVVAMATDFCANVLWHHTVPASHDMVKAQRLHLAEALIDDAIGDLKEKGFRAFGIGVSLPGLVDREKGVLLYAPNLAWANVPLGDSWSTQFGLPIFIENNANAGALGEHFLGVGQNAQSLVYLDLGWGIGGCIISDDRIIPGTNGFAGEIGHMQMIPGGPRCGCGRRGCFEAVAGAEAVLSEIVTRISHGDESLLSKQAADPTNPSIAEIAHAAALKDKLVREVLDDTSEMLGQGIANLVNIFDPQLVVLGGRMSPLLPFMRETIQSTLRENVLLKPCRVQLVDSAYGDQAAIVGAIAMVMRKVTRHPARWLPTG